MCEPNTDTLLQAGRRGGKAISVVSVAFSNCPHHRQFSGSFWRGAGKRIINHGLWSAYSSNLTTSDFYLWGNFKKSTEQNHHTENKLKDNKRWEIMDVPREELLWVNFNCMHLYRDSISSISHNIGMLSWFYLFLWNDTLIILGKSCSALR